MRDAFSALLGICQEQFSSGFCARGSFVTNRSEHFVGWPQTGFYLRFILQSMRRAPSTAACPGWAGAELREPFCRRGSECPPFSSGSVPRGMRYYGRVARRLRRAALGASASCPTKMEPQVPKAKPDQDGPGGAYPSCSAPDLIEY